MFCVADSLGMAAPEIAQQQLKMYNRSKRSALQACSDLGVVALSLNCIAAALASLARSRDADTQQSLTKAADGHEAIATLIDAGAAMSNGKSENIHVVLASLTALEQLVQSTDGAGARLCVPVSTLASSTLDRASTVWRELPDNTASTIAGPGTRSFVKGAAGATHSVVFVYPRLSSGALAEYVKPDDVRLMLKDDAGSLIHVTVGCLRFAYAVDAACARMSLFAKYKLCISVAFARPMKLHLVVCMLSAQLWGSVKRTALVSLL